MKTIKGKSLNINKNITGKVCYKNNIFLKNRIYKGDRLPLWRFGIKAIISSKELKTKIPLFVHNGVIPKENDIVNITSDGNCSIVWDSESEHNAFYLTDVCNSKCIMCPQPAQCSSYFDVCSSILESLDSKQLDYAGITGGEPTLYIDELCNLIEKITKKSKNTPEIHILTNGRAFADIKNVKRLAALDGCNITFGIPLYSSVSEEHDYITGVNGAFEQTIKGLYNLAKFRQKIEIRIVLMRQNYKKLNDIVEFIYRNLPFVVHIAFMGMEYHGRAETNYDIVSIDPVDYKKELFEAIKNCIRRNLNADIYNLPYCLVDERLENYCRDSISDWKKIFLPECGDCIKKTNCSGVFKTSFISSKNIKLIEMSSSEK